MARERKHKVKPSKEGIGKKRRNKEKRDDKAHESYEESSWQNERPSIQVMKGGGSTVHETSDKPTRTRERKRRHVAEDPSEPPDWLNSRESAGDEPRRKHAKHGEDEEPRRKRSKNLEKRERRRAEEAALEEQRAAAEQAALEHQRMDIEESTSKRKRERKRRRSRGEGDVAKTGKSGKTVHPVEEPSPKRHKKRHKKEHDRPKSKSLKKRIKKQRKKHHQKSKKRHRHLEQDESDEEASPWEDEADEVEVEVESPPPKKDKRRKKRDQGTGDDDMQVDSVDGNASSPGRKPWEPTADERLDYQRRKEGGLMPEPMYDVNAPRLSKAKARERRKAFEEKKAFACDRCPCSYTQKGNLMNHINYKHLGKGKCSRCDEVLSSATYLRRHLFTAHQVGEPDHSQEDRTCGKCGNVYTHRQNMLTHVRYIHKGAGRCPKCPKVLASAMALKRHLRTQHEIGGQKYCYLCMCGQAFTTKSNLVRHARRHSKKFLEKHPYHCPDCWRCFTYKYQLLRHLIKWHQPVPVRKEAHICAQCPIGRKAKFRRLVTKSGWKQHMDVFHSPHPRFVCGKCYKPFACPSRLRQHVNWSRRCGFKPDTRPTCRNCGQTFTQKSSLRKHRRTRICQ